MNENWILAQLNTFYNNHFTKIAFVRDSGCIAYEVFSDSNKYFLRITKPNFSDTAIQSINIHLYLQSHNFSVPRIIFTKEQTAYIKSETRYLILYEYINGESCNPELDAESLGAFIGKLHEVMRSYQGKLPKCDRHFYIERYIQIMAKKQYKNIESFSKLGDFLWEKVKDLPRGFCHGDLYRGNILKTVEGRFYLLDFDTFCEGFLLYDPALLCNMTDYFDLKDDEFEKTKNVFVRFTSTYEKVAPLCQKEKDEFFDMIAVYHFALQATIIEIFGINCVDNNFFDRQLKWLQKWQLKCNNSE